jgi:hypothetical protein
MLFHIQNPHCPIHTQEIELKFKTQEINCKTKIIN